MACSAAALLSGCGFSPALREGSPAANLQGVIQPDAPGSRVGFEFVANLEERLGVARDPRYGLSYSLSLSATGVGSTPSGETARNNLLGSATYNVYDLETQRQLTTGTVQGFTGYSTTRLIVSSNSVDRDARDRLMKILAEKVVAQLIQTAPDWMT